MLFSISACEIKDKEKEKTNEEIKEIVYYNFQITADEENPLVNCLFQFRIDGQNGSSFAIKEPGFIKLDNELLKPDSSSFSGYYYEIQKPIQDFIGTHSITILTEAGNEHTETFEFKPFYIKSKLDLVYHRKDLLIELEGLKPVDQIRVIATDTSFTSTDINKMDTLQYGKLYLSHDRLKKVVNGPINFQLIKENEKISSLPASIFGKISVSYGLKRNFMLKN